MLLTDEEKKQLLEDNDWYNFPLDLVNAVIAACEAKLREQEPVGEVVSNHRAGMYDEFPIGTLLYANPAPIPEVEAKYNELIMAVGRKFPDETRHETALKYIRKMEEPSVLAAARSGE